MNDKPLLKTPGEMISEAREAQDLTIAQLSERTKIPPKVLNALELDEYHKISGPLYIKSFLRTCASDLGLEPEIVLGLYNKISGEKQSGASGADMIWEEDKVQVSRIGLPWVQIILAAGVVAILVGVILFSMRGCGADEPETSQRGPKAPAKESLAAEGTAAAAAATADSARRNGGRRESLLPAEVEAGYKEMATQEKAAAAAAEEPVSRPSTLRPDTLALGWMLSPPEPAAEEAARIASAEASPVPDRPDAAPAEITKMVPPETKETTPKAVPKEIPDEETGGEARDFSAPAEGAGDAGSPEPAETENIPPAGTVTIVRADTPDEAPAVEKGRIDSAWPLVLRIVCDSPQEIRVKRDGDREFSGVRWPTGSVPAPEVPSAGFEAGRAYRQGDGLVVFWGADDHFSLILERVRGVQVAMNGRVRDTSKLRPGQELILDRHSAGATSGR